MAKYYYNKRFMTDTKLECVYFDLLCCLKEIPYHLSLPKDWTEINENKENFPLTSPKAPRPNIDNFLKVDKPIYLIATCSIFSDLLTPLHPPYSVSISPLSFN